MSGKTNDVRLLISMGDLQWSLTEEVTTVMVRLSVEFPFVVDRTLDEDVLNLRVREQCMQVLAGAQLTVEQSVPDELKERG